MSQPPQSPYPYPPPQWPAGYAAYGVDPRAPAKRAGTLMFILGGMLLLFGGCMGAMSAVSLDKITGPEGQQVQAMNTQLQTQAGVGISTAMRIAAITILLPGIALLVLAAFVRRGGMGAIVTSMVLSVIVVLLLGFFILSGVMSAAGGKAEAVPGICMTAVPLALFILLLVWLGGAVKAVPQVKAMGQGYAAGGWGYAVPAPPGYPAMPGYGYGMPQQQAGSQPLPPPPDVPLPPPPTG